MIFQRFNYFRVCRPLRWHSSNICDVTTVCLKELYTHFYKISLFMKMYLLSYFILSYVRTEMNVLAFMNELDQKDYRYPRTSKHFENL